MNTEYDGKLSKLSSGDIYDVNENVESQLARLTTGISAPYNGFKYTKDVNT